jgi:alpha-1,3-rhamnosyl/mannosyltransferase
LRVGFDVTNAVKRQGRGVARYVRELLRALPAADAGIEPVLHIRDHRWFQRGLIDDLLPQAERRWIAGSMKPVRADLSAFHGLGTRLPARCNIPRSYTLHDLRGYAGMTGPLDPNQRHGSRRRWDTIHRADGIICLTEYGRQRLLALFPWIGERHIVTIGHGVDHDAFYPRDARDCENALRRYELHAPYVLQVGSYFPHKNLELTLNAFALSRARQEGFSLLLVGGGPDKRYRKKLSRLVETLAIGESVRWLDEVAGEDLPVLYSAASLLIQPSRYEGFGLPILEAMASGIPGVVSSASCLPEVCGGLWPIADPDDAELMAAGMDEMLFDTARRQLAIEAGLARAASFTWLECARQTAAFLRSQSA